MEQHHSYVQKTTKEEKEEGELSDSDGETVEEGKEEGELSDSDGKTIEEGKEEGQLSDSDGKTIEEGKEEGELSDSDGEMNLMAQTQMAQTFQLNRMQRCRRTKRRRCCGKPRHFRK